MGTPILGTIVAAKVTTGNTDNTFAVADANEIQGGHQSVATLTDRDAITPERRTEGMTCWVASAGTGSGTNSALFRLVGGIGNGNWTQEFNNAPALSALSDVSIPAPNQQDVLVYSGSLWVASGALVTEQGTRSQADQVLLSLILIEQGTRSQEDQYLQSQVTDLANGASEVKAVVNAGITGLSLVGALTSGTVPVNSLTAGPGVSLTNGASTVIVSAGTTGELGYEDAIALEVFQDYATGTLPVLDRGKGWDGPAFAVGHSIALSTGANNVQTKRLVLAQGEYARKFSWGNSWTKLRLFAGIRMTGTITNPAATLRLGVGSGTRRTWVNPNTVDFIGGGLDTIQSYFLNPNAMFNFVFTPFENKRGGIRTDYGQGVGSAGKCISATGSNISLYLTEIVRGFGTSNYAIATQEPNTVNGNYNHSYSSVLHSGVLHFTSGVPFGDSAGINQSYNESAGPLNTFDLVWTSTVPLEIAYLGATRVL